MRVKQKYNYSFKNTTIVNENLGFDTNLFTLMGQKPVSLSRGRLSNENDD